MYARLARAITILAALSVALAPVTAQRTPDRFVSPPDTLVYRGCIAGVSCHTFEFFIGRINPALTNFGVVDRAYAWRLTTTAERPVNVGNRWRSDNDGELAAWSRDTQDDYSLFGSSACDYNVPYFFCVGSFTEDFWLRAYGPLEVRPTAVAPQWIRLSRVSWLPDGPATRRNLILEDPNTRILSSSVHLVLVPEPDSIALRAVALGVLAMTIRRRKVRLA